MISMDVEGRSSTTGLIDGAGDHYLSEFFAIFADHEIGVLVRIRHLYNDLGPFRQWVRNTKSASDAEAVVMDWSSIRCTDR